MFSALLNTKSSSLEKPPRRLTRTKSSSTGGDVVPSPYIYQLSDIPTCDDDVHGPDLKDLNNSVAVLAAVFPQVDIEVFREMLSTFTEESRLACVAQALLTNQVQWVRGRYRVTAQKDLQADKRQPDIGKTRERVPLEEMFRSDAYKAAVTALCYNEFKNLSRSTVRAVLAEHNHSYTLARPTLVALNAKTWRFSVSTIFSRSKKSATTGVEQHPSVVWQSTGLGSIVPSLKMTHNAELDRELFESLIDPLLEKIEAERILKDRTLAVELNNAEAEKHDAWHDCECCYTSYTFEELVACGDGHLLCFECIKRASKEAVFGQGWGRSIDITNGTLRCIAPMSDDCPRSIPRDLLERALTDDDGSRDVLDKLDERLADDNLLKTQLPLIRCPFCNYAEVDELYLPIAQQKWRLKRNGLVYAYTLGVLALLTCMMPVFLSALLISSISCFMASNKRSAIEVLISPFNNSFIRLQRRKQGLRFTCQNPRCSRASCISCQKPWTDIHICHESSLLALRTQIELAMSLAIKRTCPRCNTSFVKSSGCNKLTCVCGYQMCYVCRKDIGNGEGYRHFCEHFRPTGKEGCTSCQKCDLYRCEDDEVVVKKARLDAEKRWLEKEGKGVESGKVLKALASKDGWWARSCMHGKWPDWEVYLDTVLDFLIE